MDGPAAPTKLQFRRASVLLGAALAPLVLLIAVPAPADGAAAARKITQSIDGADISGVWVVDNYIPSRRPTEEKITRAMDGSYPPLQPWADEIYKKRQEDDRRGQGFMNSNAYCLPGGMPQMMIAPFPFQILQTPGQVTTIHEESHVHRLIHLNRKHIEDPDPSYLGDSVGHWEGDTLVVDTIGRNDKTTIDMLGMPHTDKIHVIERIRLVGPNTLENLITVDDPGAFTKPWTIRRTYTRQPPDEYPQEYFCLDGQRNTPDEHGNATFPLPDDPAAPFGPPPAR